MKICITGDSILMDAMPESYQGLVPIREYITQEVLETLQALSAEYGTKLTRCGEFVEVIL